MQDKDRERKSNRREVKAMKAEGRETYREMRRNCVMNMAGPLMTGLLYPAW